MTLGCIVVLFVLSVFIETTQSVRISNNKLVLVYKTGFDGTTRVALFNNDAEILSKKI